MEKKKKGHLVSTEKIEVIGCKIDFELLEILNNLFKICQFKQQFINQWIAQPLFKMLFNLFSTILFKFLNNIG